MMKMAMKMKASMMAWIWLLIMMSATYPAKKAMKEAKLVMSMNKKCFELEIRRNLRLFRLLNLITPFGGSLGNILKFTFLGLLSPSKVFY